MAPVRCAKTRLNRPTTPATIAPVLWPASYAAGEAAVVTGQIGQVSCGPTRTEQDFLTHIQATVAADPTVSRWHFVVDNLNTRQSESLVRFVAAESDVDDTELRVKDKVGILKSQHSRAEFLSKPDHRFASIFLDGLRYAAVPLPWKFGVPENFH